MNSINPIPPLIQYIILSLIHQLNGLRSKTGIERLLLGSLAKQTLQDTFIFRLTAFYGLFDGLEKSVLETYLQSFLMNGYLLVEQEKLILTAAGKKQLDDIKKQIENNPMQENRNKLIIDKKTKMRLKDRLTLLVQSLSYLSQNQKNFVPVIDQIDAQEWVRKKLLPYDNFKIEKLTHALHYELDQLAAFLDEMEKQLLLYRFSGSERTALSWNQLTVYLGLLKEELLIRYNIVLHKIINIVCKNKNQFPLLHSIFYEDIPIGYLSPSTHRTWNLIKNGKTIEEIVHIRKIKANTIYDHLVEIIMISPNFDLTPFVEKWKQKEVITLYDQLGVVSLADYKSRLSQGISYAELKLIIIKLLANEGWGQC